MPQSALSQEVQGTRSLSESCQNVPSTSISNPASKYNFHKKIELYKGSVSTVYKCLLSGGGSPVVVKMYHKPKMAEKHFHKLEREIAAMHAMSRGAGSSGVAQLLDTFEDTQAVYLIMECCEGGDLFKKMLLHGGKLPEAWVCVQVIAPLLRVLEHMHGLNLMHRDIKPENIFLTAEGNVKLGDFGLAVDWTKELPFSRSGTLDYMAPEVLLNPATHTQESSSVTAAQLQAKNIQPYTCAVDVWAVGCLAYELVCGRPPFEVEDEKQTASLIIYSNVIRFDASGSSAWADFVTQALIKDPTQRPDAATLLGHPWVRNNLERTASIAVRAAAASSQRAGSASEATAAAAAAVAMAAPGYQERNSRQGQGQAQAQADGEQAGIRPVSADTRPGSAGQPRPPSAASSAASASAYGSTGGSSLGGSSACGSAATAASGFSSSSRSAASSALGPSSSSGSGSGSGYGDGGGSSGARVGSRPPSAHAASGARAAASPLLVARTAPQQQASMVAPPQAAAAAISPSPSPAPAAANGGGSNLSAHGMTASVPPQQRAPPPPGPFRHAAGSTFGSNPALRSLLGAFKAASLASGNTGKDNSSITTTATHNKYGNGGTESSGYPVLGPPPPSRPVSGAANASGATTASAVAGAASVAPSAFSSCPTQLQPSTELPNTSSGGSSTAAVVGWHTPPPSPVRQSCTVPPQDQTSTSGRTEGPPLLMAPYPPALQRGPAAVNGAAGQASVNGFSSPSRLPRCAVSHSGVITGPQSNGANAACSGGGVVLSPHPPPAPSHSWGVTGRSNSVVGPCPPVLTTAADDAHPSIASTSAGYVDQLPQPQYRHGSPGPLWATPASLTASPLRRAHHASPPRQQCSAAAAPSPWHLPPSSPPRREPPASPPRQGWVQPGSPTSTAATLHELTRSWGAVVSVSVSKFFNGRRSGSGSAFASPQRQAPAAAAAGGKAQALDSYGLPPPTPVASVMPPAEYCTPKPAGVLERVKHHLRGGGGGAPAPAQAAAAYGGMGQQAQHPLPTQAPAVHGLHAVGPAPVAVVEIM